MPRRLRVGHAAPSGRSMPAAAGGFALSGVAAAVRRARRVAANTGAIAVAGQNAALTASGGGGTAPYTWYSGFDKNLFPPHTASGFWGAQSTVKEAAAPTGTMVDVTAANVTELANHIYTPNRRITLTGDIASGVFNDGNITDVDIIVPTGRILRDCTFGSFDGSRTTNRLRIRGSTVGATGTGGKLHHNFFYSPVSNLIVEGVDMSGPGGNAYAILIQDVGLPCERVALTNIRAKCGGYFYIGDASDLTVCGCSVLTGSGTTLLQEAWGFRIAYDSSKNIIFYGNDIRSDTARSNQAYHRIRFHPNNNLDNVWIYNNRLVDRVEGRILWSHSAAGNSSVDGGDMAAIWFENNEVIATGGASMEVFDAEHARVTNNTFKSNTITSSSSINFVNGVDATTVADGVKTPNTYEALPGSDPAWGGAGDPTSIAWNI